jgi:hypothetical protein
MIAEATDKAAETFSFSQADLMQYFVKSGVLENHAYKSEGGGIRILSKDGVIRDVAESSDNYNLIALKETVKKFYLIHWG